MPDLLTALRNHDLGHLRIVAALWGVELRARTPEAAAQELSATLPGPELAREVLSSLAPEARRALATLTAHGGRLPWAEFERNHGGVREMGPGRRDREQPHLKPVSAAEILFYRALVARAFFDTPEGPREFAYVPGDLLPLLPRASTGGLPSPLGRPARPAEHAREFPSDDRLLDDATTLLAALRLGSPPPHTPVPAAVVRGLLEAASLIDDSGPRAEPAKAFLELPRAEALQRLIAAWRSSTIFNELRQVPGLAFEGEWSNAPLVTRHALLDQLLAAIPRGKWWSLAALVQDVKSAVPDFQRTAGEYDAWFIRRLADGAYLRGFSAWDEVDGALIRYFISGPMHWLGLADLGGAKDGDERAAFRLRSVPRASEEKGRLAVASNGRILAPRLAPRAVRYQVARFCEWDEERPDEYRYRVTPSSLSRARTQGLKVAQLLPLLARHSAGVPPAFVKALKRWEVNGTEAWVQNQVVLRVSRPEVMDALRRSRAARFLGEILSPTAVVVKDGAQERVLGALAELGLLGEDESTKGAKLHEGGK